MSPTYVLGVVFACIILVMVFVKMRNSGMKERYGLWWYWIAFCTALLSLRFSVDLSRGDEDRRRLTEEAAILRLQVERLERRLDALEGRASSSGQPTPEKPSSRGKKGKKKR